MVTTASVITTDAATLGPDDRTGDGLLLVCRHNVQSLPAAAGGFIGLLTERRLSHCLLPTAAQLD